ncbi:hypothetical protein MUP77_16145 [Candidatus Bathyarchaeota archaeon]|nr:hypothetical protein [Candidatus Bathyarchaeota archaeon]
MIFDILNPILQRDGFIIYVSGAKEKGKTDFSLLLAEIAYLKKFRTKIATNIETESYMIEKQITNLPDLKGWLQESKHKLFILDEAGLSIPKLRFMSTMNIEIMKLLQMIRHYDAGFIGIAPSTKNIDSTFMNTDILDGHVRKITKTLAYVKDYLQNDTYFLEGIPRTSINFNSKHIAEFTMDKEAILNELPLETQVAISYSRTHNYKQTGNLFNLKSEQVRRIIWDFIAKSQNTIHNSQVGVTIHKEPPEPQQSP